MMRWCILAFLVAALLAAPALAQTGGPADTVWTLLR